MGGCWTMLTESFTNRSYDFWVKQLTGEEQCDYFCSTIDKLMNKNTYHGWKNERR